MFFISINFIFDSFFTPVGNGTEDIVRQYKHPSKLFFFSSHLYDKELEGGFEFFPGSGADDDMVHNIINVPILPIWLDPSVNTHSTRSSTQSATQRLYKVCYFFICVFFESIQ